MGEEPELPDDAQSSSGPQQQIGTILGGIGCVCVGVVLAHVAKPVATILTPHLRKMTMSKEHV